MKGPLPKLPVPKIGVPKVGLPKMGEGFPNDDVPAMDRAATGDAKQRLRDALLARMRRKPALGGLPPSKKVVGD